MAQSLAQFSASQHTHSQATNFDTKDYIIFFSAYPPDSADLINLIVAH